MTSETPIPDRDDADALADALLRVTTAFDGYSSQLRRVLSLNAHERLAIVALWSKGALTMTELGARIPLSRAAVTTLVDRLEADGLVRRRGDARDRRRIVVELTERSSERTRPVMQEWSAELQELAARRTHEEWATISKFLHEFRELNERHTEMLLGRTDDELQGLARV
jgi:DNA-binding MarR family transcriptional regulator